jgi:hypothetical protein
MECVVIGGNASLCFDSVLKLPILFIVVVVVFAIVDAELSWSK